MMSFVPMWWYWKKTKEYPTSSTGMFSEIETTPLFFIGESERRGIEISTILNARCKNGQTFFKLSTEYSEKIALALLERNVIVNTIRSDFDTPWFKVSFKS